MSFADRCRFSNVSLEQAPNLILEQRNQSSAATGRANSKPSGTGSHLGRALGEPVAVEAGVSRAQE